MRTTPLLVALALLGLTGMLPAKGGDSVPKASPDIGETAMKLLGLEGKPLKRPAPADYTSFQTPSGYTPEFDVKADISIVYSQDAKRFETWQEAGYRAHCMWGPRAGKEFCEAVTNGRPNWDEIQTTRDGKPLGHSPGAWYGAPGPLFTAMARDYFLKAIEAGAEAIIPEEPEYFSSTGYSRFFKEEWQRFYNRPWEDQVTSVQARYDSSRLKAELEKRLIAEVFRAAKEKKPSVQCVVAEHSPVNYGAWGIVCPHYGIMQLPTLDGIIGQVWTGTARTATRYAGKSEERTFENAYLEYSSLYNLTRGTGKRLWFLMDPVEDHPGRAMDDYHENYERTLIASLLFPEVDSYEVMPWPDRIFGRVPYTTEITSIVTALNDMHRQKGARWDAGSQGIATFVSDTIMWQRGEPFSSNFDSFYGITLPLLMRGIPVQVAQLERAGEEDYLDPYKVLFLCYDAMKPTDPKIHNGLARWVRRGGALVFLGGRDHYNDVREWWRKKGYASPQEDLFEKLGIKAKPVAQGTNPVASYTTVLEEKEPVNDLRNRKSYAIDLSPFLAENPDGTVYVRLADSQPLDGWGPWLAGAELEVGGKSVLRFKAGSAEEEQYLYDDVQSSLSGGGRFADLDHSWVYRFQVPEGANPTLKLDLGNQFLVQISKDHQDRALRMAGAAANSLTREFPHIDTRQRHFPLAYETDAEPLYRIEGKPGAPAFVSKVGQGHLIFLGMPAAYYAGSPEGADLLRAITRYALELQGRKYVESQHLALRRGKYYIAHCFDEPLLVPGRWVNVLDARLPVLTDPKVPAHGWVLLHEAAKPAKPTLLYASGRVEALNETDSLTAFLLSGPRKTTAAARIDAAGRKLKSAKVYDLDGKPIEARFESDTDTVLATYPHETRGAVVRIEWE